MKPYHLELTNWEFRACGDETWLPAVVPGTVHTDLLRNGLISQPFYGKNEHELQWIDKKDWEYRSKLRLEEEWQSLAITELVFAGLDTYADVFVNNVHALSADNMFRAWTVNVKGLLVAGDNEILVKFRSVVKEDLPKLAQLGYDLPAPNDQSELGGLQEQRISVFARKAPYHYGWDWGPRFLTSGIWREAVLQGRDAAAITDLYIRQNEVKREEARLTAVVEIEAPQACEGMLRITTANGQEWMQAVSVPSGKHTVEMDIVVDQPELWWCNGLGTPHLTTFQAELLDSATVLSSAEVTTGLREIKLIRKPDAKGASFQFELNGVPVFAKGSNHIPNDSFTTEITEERYRHEIATAVESNMNMLRVWGGGIYEEEVFTGCAMSMGCWSGRISCSPAACTREMSLFLRMYGRKQNTTYADCAIIPASPYGAAIMRLTPPGRNMRITWAGAGKKATAPRSAKRFGVIMKKSSTAFCRKR